MCNCKSYNRPDWGGTEKEIILPKPIWSSRVNGICVDACLARTIQYLWDNKIITYGCCCGHNKLRPHIIVEIGQKDETLNLLEKFDQRDWVILDDEDLINTDEVNKLLEWRNWQTR